MPATFPLHLTIDVLTRSWNASATPFVWTNTVDEMLANAVR